jgi:putative transposase
MLVAMPRPPRLDLADVPQHVIQRGNDRGRCFFADWDRQRYLGALREAAQRYGCAIHAYVLMTNHVHMLLTPSEKGAVSRVMQHVGRDYVRYVNTVHERSGTLWEGRFKSCLIDSDSYLLTCQRYIELNPVRAGMVPEPGQYRWSSYRHNALNAVDPIVSPHYLYLALGSTPEERGLAYSAIVREALSADDLAAIRSYTQQQRALGTTRFQAIVEGKLSRCASTRPARRPTNSELRFKRP